MNLMDGSHCDPHRRSSFQPIKPLLIALAFTLALSPLCSARAEGSSVLSSGTPASSAANPAIAASPSAATGDSATGASSPGADGNQRTGGTTLMNDGSKSTGNNGVAAGVEEDETASSNPGRSQPPELPNVDNVFSDLSQQTVPTSSGVTSRSDAGMAGGPQTAAALATIRPPVLAKPNKPAPSINLVIQNYKEGKYRDALTTIASMKPSDVTHYWTGLCYQGQNQLHQAGVEFQWVASYSRDPQLRFNAQRALMAVNRYAQGRTYAGQGNSFNRPVYSSPAPSRGGGGGG